LCTTPLMRDSSFLTRDGKEAGHELQDMVTRVGFSSVFDLSEVRN
jgi:hypothetical protein